MMGIKLISTILALASVAVEAGLLKGEKTRKLMGKKMNKDDEGDDDDSMMLEHVFENFVAIANRGGRTISLVDPTNHDSQLDYVLPDSGEPMYFGLSPFKNELWVADRANEQLLILKMAGATLSLDGTIPIPAGPFHAIITQTKTSMYPIMYTICDIAKVIVAHDVTTRRYLGLMEMPIFDEVTAEEVRPHDVTSNDDFVYVSFLVSSDTVTDIGYIAQYSVNDQFELVRVITTGPDPHVAIRDNTSLFIADQTAVTKVSATNISVIEAQTLGPAHGMFISFDSTYLYTTNIGGGGIDAIAVWNVETGQKLACPSIDTEFPVPHNPTVTEDDVLVVTHSGPTATFNSVFEIEYDGCLNPHSRASFETDINPFGIITIPPPSGELICLREGAA